MNSVIVIQTTVNVSGCSAVCKSLSKWFSQSIFVLSVPYLNLRRAKEINKGFLPVCLQMTHDKPRRGSKNQTMHFPQNAFSADAFSQIRWDKISKNSLSAMTENITAGCSASTPHYNNECTFWSSVEQKAGAGLQRSDQMSHASPYSRQVGECMRTVQAPMLDLYSEGIWWRGLGPLVTLEGVVLGDHLYLMKHS